MDLELILATAKKHINQENTPENRVHFEIAAFLYQKAIDINPQLDVAYNNLGTSLYKQRKFEEAIPLFEGAISLNPNSYSAWLNLGNTLGELKRYEEVIPVLETAIEINPENIFFNGLNIVTSPPPIANSKIKIATQN